MNYHFWKIMITFARFPSNIWSCTTDKKGSQKCPCLRGGIITVPSVFTSFCCFATHNRSIGFWCARRSL